MSKRLSERNPFVISPGEFWADREQLWGSIQKYIDIARRARSNEIILLTGGYGCGTTHTLICLQKHLATQGAVACYMTVPPDGSFVEMYSRFISSINPEERKKVVAKLVNELSERMRLERQELSLGELERVDSALSRFVEHPSTRSLSLRDRGMLASANIPSPLELWSRIVLELSSRSSPVFILIDELDQLPPIAAGAESLLYDIRRLYDDTIFGLCLVIGMKGEPSEAKDKLGPALYSRMSLQPIHLYPLSKKEAKNFVKDLLEYRGVKREKFPYYPFTEEALDSIAEASCPAVPRRLLKICSVVFESATSEGKEIIDRKYVMQIMARFGEVSFAEGSTEEEPKKETMPRRVKPRRTIPSQLPEIYKYDKTTAFALTAKAIRKSTFNETLLLILYPAGKEGLLVGELQKTLARNHITIDSDALADRLVSVIKEGMLTVSRNENNLLRYSLSAKGRNWVKKKLFPSLSHR